ncbi:nuclear transport factor 2 family protein [Rhizorhabdus dicambivorans]|uniref:SnoaL-like domain-containing protein n=1 Tax=Rhizorhabdus dicambivorans TaxID=1850238 RepID=A0A2A4FXP8_9SPHN|nr:nuclear transport factor 2 family protein [Rhizorhabdus dicambivorans]ATE63047.1 hypothetical protein CMV14_00415 [Rhizorhabdus dicambivorans]PCE43224.1 hypothetical protein COO09_05450 [Rhizorhabdus dicambivorans]
MLDRVSILAAVDDAYARRASGDKVALDAIWAPGAVFELVGRSPLMAATLPTGPAAAMDVVSTLVDRVRFHSFERLDAVVEGGQAAIRWHITASAPGGAPFEIELFDLWSFDEQYRATRLVQFTDTALLVDRIGGAALLA